MNIEEIKANAPDGANSYLKSISGLIYFLKIFHTGRIEVYKKREWHELTEESAKEIRHCIRPL
ncbi:hypothetical protein ACK14Y_09975 [Acinetobacter baumannii]|uniref:hypothetical protein n=1 Tax=Acinetobacter baumannii TaxID=470 RepID=UPI003984959B